MVKLFQTEHTYQHPWAHVTSAFWRKYPNPLATHVKQIDCYDRKLIPRQRQTSTNTATAAATAAAASATASVSVPASSVSAPLSRSVYNPSSLVARQAPSLRPTTQLTHETTSERKRPASAPEPVAMMLVTNRLVACESSVPSWMAALGIPTQAYAAETCVVDPASKEMVIKSRNITGSSIMTIEETCRYAPHSENPNWTHYTQTAKITAFLPFMSSGLESYSFSSMHEKSKKGLETIEVLCQRIKSEGLDSISSLSDTFSTLVAKLHHQAVALPAAVSAVAHASKSS
jgi:hypothetical protein